jgi:hypothetical protein
VEAWFYFQATVDAVEETLALCSLYSLADEDHREDTSGALNVCDYKGEGNLVVIRAKSILSVVGMMPFQEDRQRGRFYLTEKFALGVIDTGDTDDIED